VKNIKISLFIIVIITLFYCCRDESCKENMTSAVNVHFYKNKTTKDSSIFIFSAFGIGNEFLLYDSSKMISKIQLPLDQSKNQSTYNMILTVLDDMKLVLDSTKRDSIIKLPFPDTVTVYDPFYRKIYDTLTYSEVLTISYTLKMEMVSQECGFGNKITLDSIWSSKNIIDSIFIRKTTIERGSNEENVKIFL
jgi:hypothetical protein